MNDIPVAKDKCPGYENFVAICPWCNRESIFNRASDLCTFEPIDGRNVSCQNIDCSKSFRITGDLINNAHEMLILDCFELIERKHYMSCILNLTQAYEVFFSLYFRVELLYKPFAAGCSRNLAEMNLISEKLYNKIKDHAFARMRSLFLQHVLTRRPPKDLKQAEAVIAALPDCPGDPKDADIENLCDAKLVPLLKAIKATNNIHTLRNRIVHKQAYRPTRAEAETALQETRSILFPLTKHFRLCDDINWYLRKPRGQRKARRRFVASCGSGTAQGTE